MKIKTNQREYVICTRCIMDTSAKNICFDNNGVCNFCTEFISRSSHVIYEDPEKKKRRLEPLLKEINYKGLNNRYDCVVGVSGGVDSSWALVKAVELGLKPLAVHMDNGWNSELAQNNIANLVRKLDVDLHTHVIDWNEYKNLMQAFFDAGVIDVELLYDNAMLAVNYRLASKFNIKYILSGVNEATEGMSMPEEWNWFKFDKINIKAIGKKFGNINLKTFPAFGISDYLYYRYVKKISWLPFLDYFNFNKAESLKTLESEYGYKPYPYKHYESIFTRFYQGYLLPLKFNVDKRRIHLSTLIMSKQLSRKEALMTMQSSPYPSNKAQDEDLKYFLKKMNWSEINLRNYLEGENVMHSSYSSGIHFWHKLIKINNMLRHN